MAANIMDTSKIGQATDPKTGAVTLFLKNVKGGPVVTGANLTEAMLRWKEAFMLYKFVYAFMEV